MITVFVGSSVLQSKDLNAYNNVDNNDSHITF